MKICYKCEVLTEITAKPDNGFTPLQTYRRSLFYFIINHTELHYKNHLTLYHHKSFIFKVSFSCKIPLDETAFSLYTVFTGNVRRRNSGMYWFRRGFKSRRSEPHEMR